MAELKRIIRTECLHYDGKTGRVYTNFAGIKSRKSLGRLENMPRHLPLELIDEWNQIFEIVIQEFTGIRE